jgi:hypothetical protein
MSAHIRTTFKRRLANFFGGLGYLFCSLQWLAAILIYSSFIKAVLSSFSPAATKPVPIAPIMPITIDLASNVPLMIVSVIITLAVVVLSIYVFVKIPSTIVKTSKNVVHEVAETAAPVVLRIQHVQDTKQNHKKVTLRITIVIKALAIVVPLVLSFCSQFTTNQALSFDVAMYLSILFAGLAVISFVVQYSLAGLLSVKHQDIW